MPAFDGTGPEGYGPTGWGHGQCRRAFRKAWCRQPIILSKEEQKKILEEELKELEAEKKDIQDKLKEL